MYPIDSTTYELVISPLLPKRYWSVDNVSRGWNKVWPPQNPTIINTTDQSFDTPDTQFVSAGLISLLVFAPFLAQDPADTCTIRIFCNFEDLVIDEAYQSTGGVSNAGWTDTKPFLNPLTIDKTTLTVASGKVTYMTGWRAKTLTGINPIPNADDREMPEREANAKQKAGTWSLKTRTLAEMMRVFIPLAGVYAPLVAAASVTTSGLSKVLGFFNFDKPRENELPTRFLQSYKNFSYANGIDQAPMVALDSANSVCPVGLHQPFDKEALNIATLCAQEQVVFTTQLTTAQAAGTLLWGWAVAPWNVPVSLSAAYHGDVHFSQLVANHTYWSWISRLFQYWRAECEVTVEVIAPAFAKAYLLLSWSPGDAEGISPSQAIDGGSFAPSITLPEMLSKVIRVSGVTKTKFRVPFRSADYVLNADVQKYRDDQDPSTDVVPATNGSLWLQVNQSLTQYSPAGSSANPVTIIVSVSFPGAQFFRPSVHQMESLPCGYFETAATPTPERPVHNADDGALPTSSMGVSHTHFFGECVEDLLTLAKRPAAYSLDLLPTTGVDKTTASLFYAPASFGSHFSPDDPLYGTQAISKSAFDQRPTNVPAWISRLFLTWRGEVTYTVINQEFAQTTASSVPLQAHMSNVEMTMNTDFVLEPVDTLSPSQTMVDWPGSNIMMGMGGYVRPAQVQGQPASIVAPYYSLDTFHLTPDFLGTASTTKFGPPYVIYPNRVCPGIIAGLLPTNTTLKNVPVGRYHNIGDNFSYGGLYPPCASTVTLAPGFYETPSGYSTSYSAWPGFLP